MKSFSLLLSPSLGHFGPTPARAPSLLGPGPADPLPSPSSSLAADGWGPPVRTSPYLQPPTPDSLALARLERTARPRPPRSPHVPSPAPRLQLENTPPVRPNLLPPPFFLSSFLLPSAKAQREAAAATSARSRRPELFSSILVALVSFPLFPAPSPFFF